MQGIPYYLLKLVIVLAEMFPLDLRIREAAALYSTRKGVPQLEIEDREVERMSSALQSPHPALRIDLEFKCLVDHSRPPMTIT
ncbi:unnamed protein product [Euphydryas editha]|uniref:Uncharacterized protein n=1 Tax=Euphydryas editha TaxID=104508 RepID=A0AAU9VAM7_EUPED|nr:unnamed protein product [Euphydryas editha]